jgi:hypothetical protein
MSMGRCRGACRGLVLFSGVFDSRDDGGQVGVSAAGSAGGRVIAERRVPDGVCASMGQCSRRHPPPRCRNPTRYVTLIENRLTWNVSG